MVTIFCYAKNSNYDYSRCNSSISISNGVVMKKKGFIQIVEVALAAFLIIMALPSLFSGLNVRLEWSRTDLISSGNNMFSTLAASGNLTKVLNETQQVIRDIEKIRPMNMKYSLLVEGTPKQNILVGCPCNDAQYEYAKQLLTPTFFNGRWVNFTVNKTDINAIFQHDALLFVNYTDWTAQKQKIQDYLKSGKGIVAINGTYGTNTDFNEIFNLSAGAGSAAALNFTKYAPSENKIAKYFLGFGFDVNASASMENKKQGYWYIWENATQVNITSDRRLEIQDVGIKSEGEIFIVNSRTKNNALPDSNYAFRVKKIFSDLVFIQPLNASFVFNNFVNSNEQKVKGNNIVSNSGFAAMTVNGSAVWISDFSKSDEYRTLVKSVVASLTKKFYLVSPQNVKNEASVSTFVSGCCDMPETIKLTLTLWYIF